MKLPLLILCLAVFSGTIHAQSPDTTAGRANTFPSPRTDTTTVSGVDTVVVYSSTDSVVYNFSDRSMTLFSAGKIAYQEMQLEADRIAINWDTSVLHAAGIADTADTTGKKLKGTPRMKDGGEEYRGTGLSYNFRSKQGRINVGDTQIDQGFYHGEAIKKVDRDVLFVQDGRYTTCDAPEPHYFFASPKMKVTFQDKVVAEPVYLYIADVPIFGLPFGIFPNKRGRRSGIVAPAYGDDAKRGKFLSHLGYYWAVNDYLDLNLRSDLYTKGGWAGYADFRYGLRYNFTGSLSGEYKRLHTGEENDPLRSDETSYRATIVHNQQLDPTTRADVNFTFTSNNSYLNTIDLGQGLNQSITSNATIYRSWEGTPNSISLNVGRTQNLRDESILEVLPSINFNHGQSFPLRSSKTSGDLSDARWYEMLGLGYNATFTNTRNKFKQGVDSIRVSVEGRDTLERVEEFRRDRNQTVSQNFSLSIAPKLGPITISPSLSYQDQRSFLSSDIPSRDTSLQTVAVTSTSETRRTGFLSSGIAASTRFYGIVQPGIFGIAALRHTVTPSLSLVYSKQVFGDGYLGRQMSMNLNIGNVFEMKTTPAEEGKEPRKIQLLNVGVGVSYNFSADSLNFSPIGLSYRTGIGNLLDIGGSATFDLYQLVQVGQFQYARINKFLISQERQLARLTDFRISLSTHLAGEKSKQPQGSQQTSERDSLTGRPVPLAYRGLYREEEPDFSIPWSLSLSFDYGESKVPPFPTRSATVRGNVDFNLTEKWKFAVSGGYDIVNREVVVPDVNISRDLHCWMMNFSWVPVGEWKHYRFEIRIKAPQLQDIKVTKQGSERSIY